MVRVVRLERTVSWSQTRRDTNFAIPGYSISAMIPRRTVKIKFFLSVVIPVVKAAFVPPSAIRENPASAGVARLCGVLSCPVPDSDRRTPQASARSTVRHLNCHLIRAKHPHRTQTAGLRFYEAPLLYRLRGAVARIICGARSALAHPWLACPSWPRAPGGSRRAAF